MLVTGTVPPHPSMPTRSQRALAPFGSSRMLPRGVVPRRGGAGVGARALLRRLAVRRPGQRHRRGRDERRVRRRLRRAAHPRQGRRAARLRERLPAPRPRAAAVRWLRAGPKAIVCPYHAWTYRFDGSLIGAPGHRRVDLDKSALGLKPVEVREWHGWVFVDRTGRGHAVRGPHRRARGRRGVVRRGRRWSPRSRTSTTWRRTGRWSSRTTRSATTAR